MTSGWNSRIAVPLLLILFATTAGAAEVVVRDALTHEPVAAAISVHAVDAPLDAPAPRAPRLRAMSDGRFIAAAEGWAALFVRATGYEDQWVLPVLLSSAEPVRIELTRRELSDEERARLEEKREARRQAIYEAMPPEDFAPVESLADVNAPLLAIVPRQVWVTNLAGYTGLFDFDAYIAGVVTMEMGDGFPFEALKAQAVAARSYALERYRRTGSANGGQAYNPSPSPKSTVAAKNTTGIVMLYNGAVIQAFYSARCNGDFTLPSELGLSNTTTCIVGGLCGGCVRPYTRSRACSGHANCASTTEPCCNVIADGRQHRIYGHGVGMCQRGAQRFAGTFGQDWRTILEDYYTDITFANAPGFTVGRNVRATTSNLNLRTTPCGSAFATVPANAIGTVVEGPERPSCSLQTGTSYITWWRVQFGEQTGWVAEDFLELLPPRPFRRRPSN